MNALHSVSTTGRTDLLKLDKATLYFRNDFGMGYHKVEARDVLVQSGPCAQHTSALFFQWVPKGARKLRGDVQTSRPSLVVLEGWGHFDPADTFTTPETVPGATVSRSRFLSNDPAWTAEFGAKLDAYVQQSGARVAGDFRTHEVV